jgi:hypothetical protein
MLGFSGVNIPDSQLVPVLKMIKRDHPHLNEQELAAEFIILYIAAHLFKQDLRDRMSHNAMRWYIRHAIKCN